MKQLIIIIVLSCLHNCTSQTKKKENVIVKDTISDSLTIKKNKIITKKNSLKTDVMERFNIEDYKNLEKDFDYYTSDSEYNRHYKLEDKKIHIWFHNDQIIVDETNIKNPFSISKSFYKSNKSLKYYTKVFYSFPIGISKEYDKNGKLIKETNWDLPFKFSIEDLEQKMKKEYDIDIMNINEVFLVIRGKGVEQNENLTHYIIIIETRSHEFQEYLIDGISGKTLFISEPSYDEDEEGIIEKYFSKEARQKNLYTRYKGKEYTRKEWEAYQKTKEYKKALEEYNKKGLWDKLFGN